MSNYPQSEIAFDPANTSGPFTSTFRVEQAPAPYPHPSSIASANSSDVSLAPSHSSYFQSSSDEHFQSAIPTSANQYTQPSTSEYENELGLLKVALPYQLPVPAHYGQTLNGSQPFPRDNYVPQRSTNTSDHLHAPAQHYVPPAPAHHVDSSNDPRAFTHYYHAQNISSSPHNIALDDPRAEFLDITTILTLESILTSPRCPLDFQLIQQTISHGELRAEDWFKRKGMDVPVRPPDFKSMVMSQVTCHFTTIKTGCQSILEPSISFDGGGVLFYLKEDRSFPTAADLKLRVSRLLDDFAFMRLDILAPLFNRLMLPLFARIIFIYKKYTDSLAQWWGALPLSIYVTFLVLFRQSLKGRTRGFLDYARLMHPENIGIFDKLYVLCENLNMEQTLQNEFLSKYGLLLLFF
jgi:hypothetical protein